MTPFFLISTPRSRGTLLMRMLDATVGVRCSGEASPLLDQLRRLDTLPSREAAKHAGETWPMHRQHVAAAGWSAAVAATLRAWTNPEPGSTHYGVRSSFLGREGWQDAVGAWSWLLETWPDARIVFLGRDQEEIERSMLWTGHLWRPAYGNCPGACGGKVHNHLQSMRDFHEINPDRSTLLDAADLLDFDKTAAALAAVGIPLDRDAWAAELAVVTGSRDQVRKLPKPAPAAQPAKEHPFFDPATTYEDALRIEAAADPAAVLAAWEADPFGDLVDRKRVADYVPKPPRRFVERAAMHPEAIVYPWLSTAAAWEELLRSCRSVHRHFADSDCPIYILGDRKPDWLAEGGRVRFLPMDYSRGRSRGLHQAFATGLQIADRVLWMNDDIYLLQDQGWSDFAVALTEGVLNGRETAMLKSPNHWQRSVADAVLDLRSRGVGTVHRFTTHTPYLFEREKSLEILRKFHLPYKGGWVTRYHAWHRTPHRPCGTLKTNTLPAGDAARFLNHNDATLTAGLKRQIAARFADPAPWELPAEPPVDAAAEMAADFH